MNCDENITKHFTGQNPFIIVPNSINNKQQCKLVSTKQNDKYTKIYNPMEIFAQLKKYNQILAKQDNQLEEQLNNNLKKKFDFNIRNNCCNCISITVYFNVNYNNAKYTAIYLRSIKRTIQNVENCLPDWIVRLYFDKTVYDFLLYFNANGYSLAENNICGLLKFIFNSKNTEIYTYLCDNSEQDLKKTRTYRFLTFMDTEVNISIIREADGIVTNLDCQNIRIFENNQKIFYFPPIKGIKTNLMIFQPIIFYSYSKWLRFYKAYIDNNYFSNHQNFYDILAGTLATKLKLNKIYYENTIKDLDNKIKNVCSNEFCSVENKQNPNISYEIINKTIPFFEEKINDKEINIFPKINKKLYDEVMSAGFDEILLLELFKDIICIQIKPIISNDKKPITFEYNEEQKKYILELIYSYHNIKNVKFNVDNINATLDPLVQLNIITEENKQKNAEIYKKYYNELDFMENYTENQKMYIIDTFFKNSNKMNNLMLDIIDDINDTSILSQINNPYVTGIGNMFKTNDEIYDGKYDVKSSNQMGGLLLKYNKKYLLLKK